MYKQLFFLVLFPLALHAQQPRDRDFAAATFFGGEEAFFALASPPDWAEEEGTLPNAPEPRPSESTPHEGAPPTAVSQPARVQALESAVARGEIWNRKFLAAHAAFLGSIVYDAELTHQGLAHHNCVEGNPNLGSHPSRGDLYRINGLAFGAISGFDWFAAKSKMRLVPYIGPIVGTAIHLTAGSKWLSECW